MIEEIRTRRDFLKAGVTVFGVSMVGLNMPQVLMAGQKAEKNLQTRADYKNISVLEAAELSAIVDQVIPEDETPGATEIGVVYFIDVALGGFMAGAAPMIRQGLEELQQNVKNSNSGASRFSEIPFEQQTAFIKSIEETPFFEQVHFLTMCGMFALPKYGGNRNHAGWDLVGFNHQHAWLPPFGYYDAKAQNQQARLGEDLEHI